MSGVAHADNMQTEPHGTAAAALIECCANGSNLCSTATPGVDSTPAFGDRFPSASHCELTSWHVACVKPNGCLKVRSSPSRSSGSTRPNLPPSLMWRGGSGNGGSSESGGGSSSGTGGGSSASKVSSGGGGGARSQIIRDRPPTPSTRTC